MTPAEAREFLLEKLEYMRSAGWYDREFAVQHMLDNLVLAVCEMLEREEKRCEQKQSQSC